MPGPYSQPSADSRSRSQGYGDLPDAPAAERLRRPSWRDPRLLAGLLIVALSIAGVIALLASQNRTTQIYAADRLLTVGERITVEDLRVVEVQIDDVAESYLSAAEELPQGSVFVAAVAEGELVPRRAVAQEDLQGRQAVTVEVEHTLARGVDPGRMVDVWAADAGALGQQQEVQVERIAAGSQVSAITEASGTFGAQTAVTVELLVDPDELPALLAARSSSAMLSVVPAGTDPDPAESEPAEED
ncbi:hypothetical protein [Nesterenkonia lutea]|uniref:Flp pilus assembly protein CpaB n=1 Tax=Nesterenkonia lutea TaxID=272919 RepID=A0ABR9JEZ1_9MICC|nr:hypothetical protein [Nesterenkonia lutea]MBE1524507.1 Flp pilus assembly protein CpaB [Nesterenkonia lutea]